MMISGSPDYGLGFSAWYWDLCGSSMCPQHLQGLQKELKRLVSLPDPSLPSSQAVFKRTQLFLHLLRCVCEGNIAKNNWPCIMSEDTCTLNCLLPLAILPTCKDYSCVCEDVGNSCFPCRPCHRKVVFIRTEQEGQCVGPWDEGKCQALGACVALGQMSGPVFFQSFWKIVCCD